MKHNFLQYRFRRLLILAALAPLPALSQEAAEFAHKMMLNPGLFASGDENWDDRFTPPGVDPTEVGVIAVNGSDVYVGGFFTMAGGVTVNHIARWDGNKWSALGNGVGAGQLTATVYDIAFQGNDVYVAGSFTTPFNRIAKWDGARWSGVGGGVSGGSFAEIRALAATPTELYAGGIFTDAGGELTVNHIAKWDGSAWSALGTGMSGGLPPLVTSVDAIAAVGNNLYAGGNFTSAGGVVVNSIARWDGSRWSALSNGISSSTNTLSINAIAPMGSDVFVGGSFTMAGNVAVNNIAKWNGATWSALGTGANNGVMPGASALAVSGSTLYVGGTIDLAGGVSANNVAAWNGSSWSAVGSGLSAPVVALGVSGNSLYVGGALLSAGNAIVNGIAKWEAGAWLALGSSVNGAVFTTIAATNGEVYLGGEFSSAGNVVVNHIVKWNGNNWSALGTGVNGPVRAAALDGNDLFVGGEFTSAGGMNASKIAKWDGSNWSALGSGLGGAGTVRVNAVAVKGNEIYVAGAFTTAGGVQANNIAKWDGANWSALGSGANNGVNNPVSAITITSNGEVHVGGNFTTAGGVNAKGIARWNGTAWSEVGGGVSGGLQTVYSLASRGDEVYVGGLFSSAGNVSARSLAKWDGSNWSALGSGLSVSNDVPRAYALAVSGNDLYVGGYFVTAGGVTVNGVAKWNGSAWSELGSGIGGDNPTVLAAAATASEVYVGGGFASAGEKPSFKFGRWKVSTTSVESNDPQPKSFVLQQNYPNPFWSGATSRAAGNPSTSISYEIAKASPVVLKIFNVFGQEVRTLVDKKQAAGFYRVQWDGKDDEGRSLASGVYLYQLIANDFVDTRKMVLTR
jgi:hypothetical protein